MIFNFENKQLDTLLVWLQKLLPGLPCQTFLLNNAGEL